jgi:hypothetical protein
MLHVRALRALTPFENGSAIWIEASCVVLQAICNRGVIWNRAAAQAENIWFARAALSKSAVIRAKRFAYRHGK